MEKLDRIKELVALLNKAGKSYYSEGQEIMSNYEYDALYDELVALEEKTGVVLSGSPTVQVGYETLSELPKEAHIAPMLSLGKTIQAFVPEAQHFLEELFTDNSEIRAWLNNLDVDLDKLLDSVIAFFRNGAGNVLNSTVYAIGSIVNGVTTFVIAFVFACYILLQKEKLGVQVKKVMHAFLKEKWEKRCLKVCTLTSKTFSNFLTGQCLEALILGSMFFVAMSLFKMPYALLVGVLVAFTALIPIFGAFIGCVVGAFLILMVDPLQALFFVIMFLVLQQIEGNLIYPKVVGNSVGLPSIWVLAAVTIGGSLMGVVGMLIFIPLVSVVYTLFRESVYKRLEQKQR